MRLFSEFTAFYPLATTHEDEGLRRYSHSCLGRQSGLVGLEGQFSLRFDSCLNVIFDYEGCDEMICDLSGLTWRVGVPHMEVKSDAWQFQVDFPSCHPSRF